MYKISIYGCAMFKKLVCQWIKSIRNVYIFTSTQNEVLNTIQISIPAPNLLSSLIIFILEKYRVGPVAQSV